MCVCVYLPTCKTNALHPLGLCADPSLLVNHQLIRGNTEVATHQHSRIHSSNPNPMEKHTKKTKYDLLFSSFVDIPYEKSNYNFFFIYPFSVHLHGHKLLAEFKKKSIYIYIYFLEAVTCKNKKQKKKS